MLTSHQSFFSASCRTQLRSSDTCPLHDVVVGWCDGSWVHSSAGRPTYWIIEGQGPIALTVGAGCLDIFSLIYNFSPLSLSLGDGPI